MCQRGDWLRRVQGVQAVPGRAGWIPAHRHLDRSCSEITHGWIGPGGPGLRLQTGLGSGCCTRHVPSQAGAAGATAGLHVPQPGQDRRALEISWGSKAKDDLAMLGAWRRAFGVICYYKESRLRAQPRCNRRHPRWDTEPKAPNSLRL